ncbi:CHAT domain-containing protein [Novosphingobium sp. PY1]|uniref:CHAT domain-containing protein n=1 Tax=Novosphingobium sp. PY1 TaxID=1882221 RepID=UPI001A8C8E37|nr:CHAT domain-containing protein [Novosphingobium sp. PY1]GFM28142.1 uncharacterized protein PY1_contig-04-190 [Novosphingobium sp. PY1]
MKRDYQPDIQIKYVFVVPNAPLDKRSIFQGFTTEIFDYIPFLPNLVKLPPNVIDPSLPRPIRLARHAAGQSSWLATPVSDSSLIKLSANEVLEKPFFVTFSATKNAADSIADWAASLPVPILHVALGPYDNAITPDQLTQASLQQHAFAVLEALTNHYAKAPLDRVREIVGNWKERDVVNSREDLVSHLTTIPNLLSLAAGGIDGPTSKERWTGKDEAAYIEEIVKSYDAVQTLRDDIPFQPLHRIAPAQPDVFVVAPAHYRFNWANMASASPKEERSAVRNLLNGLVRQSGFRRSFGDDAAIRASPLARMMLRERIGELTLFALAIGLRAASTLSAVVRVPPAVNRASGLIGQLGQMARTQELRDRSKLERTFASVQKRLKETVGAELLRCINESAHGVKVISDAPLEWLPIGDLPLVLAHNTSRLTSTPGDLLMTQLVDNETITIPVDAFRDILVISSFKSDDRLSTLVKKSIEMMAPAWPKGRLNIVSVDVTTTEELVKAFNEFDGPMAIFDGHGVHDTATNISYLMIGDTPVDVWSLRGKLRVPPIVMLSACDTQAIDGSHATTANGFISLGARAVVATLLPVHGIHASLFVARMMLRIAQFVPAAITEYGRGILWSEMVSGLQRMNLLSDLIMALLDKKIIDDGQYNRIGTYGNGVINSLDRRWLERIKEEIIRETGMQPGELDRRIRNVIACSDAIRYAQIGNPETIVIGDVGDVSEGLLKVDPESDDGIRLRELTEIRAELIANARASLVGKRL